MVIWTTFANNLHKTLMMIFPYRPDYSSTQTGAAARIQNLREHWSEQLLPEESLSSTAA